MHRLLAVFAIVGTLLGTPPSGAAAAEWDDFAGVWARHGFALQVQPDGWARASWRAYQWCGPGVTGLCDEIRGNEIVPGGNAEIRFEERRGETAYGVVLSSSDPQLVELGRVSLTLLAHGMAAWGESADGDPYVLCGPRYAELAPREIRDTYPCGA